eukprot:TRINITY_DN3661_c1_g1_i1.p1 TRINITY_DN3661_c1_g1~~TRINITY_DN3661_c1_g1_i1.p1  ORF type:complete len:567 (+),score=120.34 TRINITY_DN3661_c1_g1_i1:326-2026(+)
MALFAQQPYPREPSLSRAHRAEPAPLPPATHFILPAELAWGRSPSGPDTPSTPDRPTRPGSGEAVSRPPSAGSSVAGRTDYRLILCHEDEAYCRQRRAQDVPTCRLSISTRVSCTRAGESPRGGRRPAAKLGALAQAHRGAPTRVGGPTGACDALAAVNNHDSHGRSSLSVYDVSRASNAPVVTIEAQGLLLCHCINSQGQVACGLLSGETLVYSIPQHAFVSKLPSPWREKPSEQRKANDAQAATCCTWISTPRAEPGGHLLVGHQHGCLYRYAVSASASVETLTIDDASTSGGAFAVRRQAKRGANPQMAMRLSAQALSALSCTADGVALAASSRDGHCYVVDMAASPRLRAKLEVCCGACLCCAWSPCGTLLAAGAQDDSVMLYASAGPLPLARLHGLHNWPAAVWVLTPRPDGRAIVAAAGEDGRLVLWDPPCTAGAGGGEPPSAGSPSAVSPAQVLVSDVPPSPAPPPARPAAQCLVTSDAQGTALVAAPRWATRHVLPEIDPATVFDKLHGGSPLSGLALLECGTVVTSCAQGVLCVWRSAKQQREQQQPEARAAWRDGR